MFSLSCINIVHYTYLYKCKEYSYHICPWYSSCRKCCSNYRTIGNVEKIVCQSLKYWIWESWPGGGYPPDFGDSGSVCESCERRAAPRETSCITVCEFEYEAIRYRPNCPPESYQFYNLKSLILNRLNRSINFANMFSDISFTQGVS